MQLALTINNDPLILYSFISFSSRPVALIYLPYKYIIQQLLNVANIKINIYLNNLLYTLDCIKQMLYNTVKR